jgi:hypothetical protein
MNNDPSSQSVRVTVFQSGVGMIKVPMPPGALTVTVDPGASTHNANTYPTGFVYEIQVETNSTQVYPYVSVWPGNFGEAIPGTAITASSFLLQMHTAPNAPPLQPPTLIAVRGSPDSNSAMTGRSTLPTQPSLQQNRVAESSEPCAPNRDNIIPGLV